MFRLPGRPAAVHFPRHASAPRFLTISLAVFAVTVGVGGVAALATGATDPSAAPVAHAPAPVFSTAAPAPTPSALGLRTSAPPVVAALPQVAALRAVTVPDVMVMSPTPLTATQVAVATRAGNATASNEVDSAPVRLGQGTTTALGVDPGAFRAFTPPNTAVSTPLWRSVAGGNAAVAHAVAKALNVPLGGTTTVGVRTPIRERVGAYATTGLPGIGIVVDKKQSAALGLVPDTGLLLTARGQDPVITAARVADALGKSVKVTSLRFATTSGRLQWVAPASGPITSPFGYRSSPSPEFHAGIDIGAPLGAPIYAAADGVVQYAGPASGFGNEIILTHAGGVTTVYGHMRIILVPRGTVKAGQPIALVGAEGDSTGPHLHFEVHVGAQLVNPLTWLEQHGVKVGH